MNHATGKPHVKAAIINVMNYEGEPTVKLKLANDVKLIANSKIEQHEIKQNLNTTLKEI